MTLRRQNLRRGLVGVAIASMACAVVAGCALVPQMGAGTAAAQFEVTDLSNKTTVRPQGGTALQFPASSAPEVKVVGTSGAQRMDVFVTATVPACGTQPVPAAYATKQVVFPRTPAEQANVLTQDWPLSGWTLKLMGLCKDPSSPAYPAPDSPAGSFLIRAQVQDAAGKWSESDLTIQIAVAQ